MEHCNRFLKTKVSIRAVDNEPNKRVIEGLIPYNKKSVNLGWDDAPQFEIITPSAFTKTLGDKAKVVALFSHDRSKVLGNTRAGTLELESTEEGLICRCTLGNTSWANDTWDMISRGDCDQMSFGFIPYKVRTEGNIDYLESVKLDEVSFCVLDPAYEDTKSQALRSLKDIKRAIELLNDEDKENLKNTILDREDEPLGESDEMTEKQINEIIEKVTENVLAKLSELKAEEKQNGEETSVEQSKDIVQEEENRESEVITEEEEKKETESEEVEEETPAPETNEKDELLGEIDKMLEEEDEE